MAACRASTDPNIHCGVVLALATGARLSNINNLTWDDVDLKAWRLRFKHTKNAQPRYVPVVGSAQRVLQGQFDRDPTQKGWVFKGSRDAAPADLDKPWRVVRAAAGLVGEKHCRFHDLRHSTASYLTMNGASLAEVAEALGHRTLVMAKRYSHQSGEHVRSTFERIADKLGQRSNPTPDGFRQSGRTRGVQPRAGLTLKRKALAMKAKRKSDIPGNSSAQSLLDCDWDDRWRYSGTREQLIAAELARDGDFPGDQDAPACSHTIKRDDRLMYISVHSRVADPITFWLIIFKKAISLAKAEAKRGRDEQKAARAARRAEWRNVDRKDAEEAQRRIAARIAKLPSSPTEYRDRVAFALRVAASHVRAALVGQGHVFGGVNDKYVTDGYRIDSESLSAFDEAIDEAIGVLRSARAIPDKRSRDAFVMEIRGEEAKKDRRFGSFMRQIVPTSASPQSE